MELKLIEIMPNNINCLINVQTIRIYFGESIYCCISGETVSYVYEFLKVKYMFKKNVEIKNVKCKLKSVINIIFIYQSIKIGIYT